MQQQTDKSERGAEDSRDGLEADIKPVQTTEDIETRQGDEPAHGDTEDDLQGRAPELPVAGAHAEDESEDAEASDRDDE